MATGLVKWWRARFLAGYKPFSVVGGIAEGSDSEELLTAGVATPCNSSPLPSATSPLVPETPPITVHNSVSSSTAPTNHVDEQPPVSNTRQLSFEEFECDVSVAEGNRRRQEFSFTLYDFDGHGKITKDDIAGLVTTIYDTLGASIQVPPCGSKTIKVKLTVSPDKSIGQGGSPAGTKSSNLPSNVGANTSCCHVKPVNSCSHATHASRRVPRRRRVVRNRTETERVIESHSEDDGDNVPVSQLKQEELRRRVGPVPHLPSPYSNSSEGDISDDSEISPTITPLTPLVSNHRKRSGSMQRQQLLEIIQANMEKNNLSFHASRKRHQSEHLRVPLQRCYAEPVSPYVQRSRPPSASRQPPAYHKPVREYSHHATSLSKLPAKGRRNQRKTRNHTSNQCNVDTTPTIKQLRNNLQTTPVTPNTLNIDSTQNNQNINNTHLNNDMKRNEAQFQSQSASKASKKHQLKHATREQDQARAMEQVVRWLEREFSQNTVANTAAGRRHVHEHIHHHYHHYAEALV
ncbi:protein naked cuticle homolog [Chelonus insularis]|uniref:protein naked cuticle homolog n=1 Tax=Chelonus insularis TaxID=460826 RepID=UPI00158A0C0C|nr:protein naked cuticle homolog [Chelonus insularis]